MRKVLWLFIGMISAVLFSTTVVAAPWNAPINVRIVQKSNTDNARVFSTIQAALSSITDASATNPYLIKVMPGIYDLGSASLQMKEYVTISGAEKESTKIIHAAITGAANSALTDVSLDSSSISATSIQSAMTLRNLDITVTNMMYPLFFTDASVDIDNVKLSAFADATTMGTWAICFSNNNSGSTNNKVSIKNSTITINSVNTDGIGIADLYASGAVEIDSTTITINAGAGVAYGVFRVKSTSNSKIIVNSSQQYSAAFETFGLTKIYNTYVEAATPFFNYTGGSPMCANVYDANLARICP